MSNACAFIFQLYFRPDTPKEVLSIVKYLCGPRDASDAMYTKAALAIFGTVDISPRQLSIFYSANVPYYFTDINRHDTQADLSVIKEVATGIRTAYMLRSYAGTKLIPDDALPILNWLFPYLINPREGLTSAIGWTDYSLLMYNPVHRILLSDTEITFAGTKGELDIEDCSIDELTPLYPHTYKNAFQHRMDPLTDLELATEE